MTEFVFSEPETIKVADLRAGDFVVEFPRQDGIAGKRIDSGVRRVRWDVEIEPFHPQHWYRQSRRRGPKLFERCRVVEFLTTGITPIDVPAETSVVVRRRIATGR